MKTLQQGEYISIQQGCQQLKLEICGGRDYKAEKDEFYRQVSAQLEELDYRELYSAYAPGDYYLCKNGRILDNVGTVTEHSKDGTTREVTRYRCEDCSDCPYRAACCKARDPEQRKELAVCWEFAEYREASLARITTEEGKLLRVNRSIQAEGAFGQLKHNRNFARFQTAGSIRHMALVCVRLFQLLYGFVATGRHMKGTAAVSCASATAP